VIIQGFAARKANDLRQMYELGERIRAAMQEHGRKTLAFTDRYNAILASGDVNALEGLVAPAAELRHAQGVVDGLMMAFTCLWPTEPEALEFVASTGVIWGGRLATTEQMFAAFARTLAEMAQSEQKGGDAS
jgi:hypothetical protein